MSNMFKSINVMKLDDVYGILDRFDADIKYDIFENMLHVYMKKGNVNSFYLWNIEEHKGIKYIIADDYEIVNQLFKMKKEIDELIRANDIKMPSFVEYEMYDNEDIELWVSLYIVTKTYDKSEYCWNEKSFLVKTLPSFGGRDNLEVICNRLKKYAIENKLSNCDINSVNGGQDVFICFEMNPGSEQNIETIRI